MEIKKMTREEQINKEAYMQEELLYMDAESFIEGAKWADKKPKSPWISVEDDLPCNHKELMENEYKTKKVLVVMRSDKSSSKNIEICYMTNQYSSMGNWYWINTLKTHVTHWMPLPEFPQK